MIVVELEFTDGSLFIRKIDLDDDAIPRVIVLSGFVDRYFEIACMGEKEVWIYEEMQPYYINAED